MKVICNREGLLNACQLINAAVAAREVTNISPVLRNLKIHAEKDRCTLVATDTEVGIRMEVRSITVEEPGEALLPAGRVLSILREATDDELTIDSNPDKTLLRGHSMEYQLPGEDPSAFPEFPEFSDDNYHDFQAGALREMIRRTQFAVESKESARYGAMTGILWELKGNAAKLVATDGRRMALADGTAEEKGKHSTEGQTAVAPIKAMTLLERNLLEPDETVRVCIHPNEILIKTDRSTIYSRLVEGRFPNYEQALPKKADKKISLAVGSFHTAVRQAAIITDEETKRIVLTFADNNVTLQARGVDAGSSKVDMPIEYKADKIEVYFDPRFLSDMLRVLEPDVTLTLELNDGKSPALFSNETGDYRYVVVPMVIKD